MFCGHSHFGGRRARWGGFMAGAGRFFGAGEVRLALLSLLADEPMHGYELMKRLEERSGGLYRASAGTVYPTLQQLEDEGMIVAETREGRKVYRLTEAGRRELDARRESIDQIWRRARGWHEWRWAFNPEAAEIIGPAERLVKAAFRAVAGERATAAGIERVREILLRALREVERFGGGEGGTGSEKS